MDYRGVDMVCPRCKSDFHEGEDERTLRCPSCGSSYPVVLGIPDLRIFSDPYVDLEADRQKGIALAERCEGLSFSESVGAYYEQAEKVPREQADIFKRGLAAAVPRSEAVLSMWESRAQRGRSTTSHLRLLDVGCGTAPLLVTAARRYRHVVGVDIAFRWLVMAKKRLEEADLEVPLVCACAEALPFRSGAFDRVVAESVLEHVQDQPRSLRECHRVLDPEGRFFITTPNRYSPGPDPHVGVWTGGLWPRFAMEAYVRRRGGNPPQRQLLSVLSLRRRLREAGFAAPDVYLPDVAPEQREHFDTGKRLLIDAYQKAKAMPGIRPLLLRVAPLLSAVTRKRESQHGEIAGSY